MNLRRDVPLHLLAIIGAMWHVRGVHGACPVTVSRVSRNKSLRSYGARELKLGV